MKKRILKVSIILFVLAGLGTVAYLVFASSRYTATGHEFWNAKQQTLGKDDSDPNQLFYGISDVFSDVDGNLYVVEQGNQRVPVFDKTGTFVRTLGMKGQGPGQFMAPIAGGSSAENVYIADEQTQKVIVFNRHDGTFLYDFKLNGRPSDLCVNQSGDLLIGYMTANGKIIHRYHPDGTYVASFGTLDKKYKALVYFNKVCSMAMDSRDNLYVCYRYINLVQKYNAKGELVHESATQFEFPKDAGLHQNAQGAFQARAMFWSAFLHNGNLCLVTAMGGPIARILKSDNYTIFMNQDLQQQRVVKNPFPVLCGTTTADGKAILCDLDFVVHIYQK